MANVLIAGCGYVGTALGMRLASEGHHVWGLRRGVGALPCGIRPFPADLTAPETLRALPSTLDVVFYTAAADRSDDEAYRAVYVDGLRNLLDALVDQGQRIHRMIYTSSTGVYAQSSGEWVDESSPAEPRDFSGARILEGERLLLDGPSAATVLRLGGIYGPGRTRLIDRVRQGIGAPMEGSAVYANRIHRDDCAGALRHLMMLDQPDHLYLGVDHEPAEQGEVFRWLAAQLGVPPPLNAATIDPPTARHGSNKRCRNAKLVGSGYRFYFPTFREGYAALLREAYSVRQ